MVLHIASPFVLSKNNCNLRAWILAIFWLLGLFFGVYIASTSGNYVSTLMRTAVLSRVSIVGLVMMQAFPLIVSALAAYFAVPALFYPISALKAFCYGFSLYGVAETFGDAGWLIRFLFLFSDTVTTPVLLLFWYRHLVGSRDSLKKDLSVCCVIAVFVSIVEYFVVSPFLVMLMNH